MLQSSTIIQLIAGISTLALFYMGMYFWNLAEGKGNEKHRLFAIIFFIVTAIGLGYFFFNLITTTPFSFGNGFLAFIKALIVIIIGIEIFLYSIDELKKGILQSECVAIATVITLGIIAIGMVLSAELINSAIEAVVDLVTLEEHPLAKIAKDCSSAATFVLACMAAIIGLVVYIPYIMGVLGL